MRAWRSGWKLAGRAVGERRQNFLAIWAERRVYMRIGQRDTVPEAKKTEMHTGKVRKKEKEEREAVIGVIEQMRMRVCLACQE